MRTCTYSLQQVFSQACQLLFQAKLSFHRHEQIHELNSHTRSLTAQFYTVLGFSFSAFTAAQACHPAFCTAQVAGASSSFCGGGATLEQPPFDSTYLSVSRLYSVHAACFKLGHQTRGKAMTCSCICHWISVVSLLLGKQTASGQL